MIRLHAPAVCLAAVLTLAACQRQTPEERLGAAGEAMQKGDTLGAMLEAKEIIKKHPDSPEALQAHMILGQTYLRDQQPEEALREFDAVLAQTSQKDLIGKEALKLYLLVLQQTGKFNEALETVDRYQEDYADDEATSLNLTVARADILTNRGETTASRQILTGLKEMTTSTAEVDLYRNLIGRTYLIEGDTTGALEYFLGELDSIQDEAQKRQILIGTASLAAEAGDIQRTRQLLTQATELYAGALRDELDGNQKMSLALGLADGYFKSGNFKGAEQIYAELAELQLEPQLAGFVIMGRAEMMARQGRWKDAIGWLREQAPKYPNIPLSEKATQVEAELPRFEAETDTSPLALDLRENPILPPKLGFGEQTTATLAPEDAESTTGSLNEAATTETMTEANLTTASEVD